MDHVRAHGFYPPFLFENGNLKPITGNTLASGGHAFGVRKTGLPVSSWPERMKEWMIRLKLL